MRILASNRVAMVLSSYFYTDTHRHITWHKIAPQLVEQFTVVPDSREYGVSTEPINPEAGIYSIRVMTKDVVAIIEALRFDEYRP